MRLIPDYYLQIRDLILYNEKVKNPFKIVALGDIHLSRLVDERKLDSIKYQLDYEQGNYIVFLGDLIDTPKELENPEKRQQLLDLIKTAAGIAPTMVILGSHDYVEEAHFKNYDEYTVTFDKYFWNEVANIDNVYLLIDNFYKDNQVLFMGYVETLEYYFNNKNGHCEDLEAFYEDFSKHPELYQNLPKDVVNIGLIHSPEYAKLAKNVELLKEYDLLIGGHDHDGCIPFGIGNFRRGIISPKKEILPKDVRGFRELATGTNLLISGGIVKIQDCAPQIIHPLNHLCPMQMDTITYTPDEKEKGMSRRLIYTKSTKR